MCMKWWDWMPWSLFSECWVSSQLFRSPLSLSSRWFWRLKVSKYFFDSLKIVSPFLLESWTFSVFLETTSVIYPDISIPGRCLRLWHTLFFWFWLIALLPVLAFELLYHHIAWKSEDCPCHLPDNNDSLYQNWCSYNNSGFMLKSRSKWSCYRKMLSTKGFIVLWHPWEISGYEAYFFIR